MAYDNPRPSSQPVGSIDLAVAKDDLITLDLMVTAESGTEITNRKGQKLTPLVDVVDGANSIIADELNRAPFQIVGDFADGFQIDYRSQVGQATDGTIWRYTGALPFTVPAGTVPISPTYEQLFDTDHDLLSNLNGRGHGEIHRIETTVAEVATGKYQVNDRLILTDRGGAKFNVVSGGTSNGFGVLDAGNGNTAVYDAAQIVDVEGFGAVAGATSTQAIKDAIDFAIANEKDTVQCNINTKSANIVQAAKVFLVGNGSIDGLYKNYVRSVNDKDSAFFNCVSVAGLRRVQRYKNVKVVAFGDSTYTKRADAISESDSVWNIFCKRLAAMYPDKNFTFVNRAIGGQTWTNARKGNLPTDFPSWYTNTSRNWMEYVEDESPDLVLVGFGMNDKQNFVAADMDQVMLELKASTSNVKTPDIVVGTNLTPSKFVAGYAEKAEQEGRDFVAGYERLKCLAEGIPMLDFNRQLSVVRDGYDVFESSMVRLQTHTSDNITNGKYTSPVECRDFTIIADVVGGTSAIFNGTNGTLALKTGRGEHDLLFITSVGGFLRFRLFYQAGVAYKDIQTTFPEPLGTYAILVNKSGNRLSVKFSETADVDFVIDISDFICHGGVFAPEFGYFGTNNGPFSSVSFSYGEQTRYKPSILDSDVFGDLGGGAPQLLLPNGGNGVNHPSSVGCSVIYSPVVESADFTRDFKYSGVRNTFFPNISESDPVIASIQNNNVTLNGSVVSNDGSTDLVVLDPFAYAGRQKIVSSSVFTGGAWVSAVLLISAAGSVKILSPAISAGDTINLSGVSYTLRDVQTD